MFYNLELLSTMKSIYRKMFHRIKIWHRQQNQYKILFVLTVTYLLYLVILYFRSIILQCFFYIKVHLCIESVGYYFHLYSTHTLISIKIGRSGKERKDNPCHLLTTQWLMSVYKLRIILILLYHHMFFFAFLFFFFFLKMTDLIKKMN